MPRQAGNSRQSRGFYLSVAHACPSVPTLLSSGKDVLPSQGDPEGLGDPETAQGCWRQLLPPPPPQKQIRNWGIPPQRSSTEGDWLGFNCSLTPGHRFKTNDCMSQYADGHMGDHPSSTEPEFTSLSLGLSFPEIGASGSPPALVAVTLLSPGCTQGP